MRAPGLRLWGPDAALIAGGAALTVLAAYASVRMGVQLGVGPLLVVAAFAATVFGFVSYPHLAVAGTVVLFTLVPMLKVFVSAEVGAVKDLVVLAAVCGGAILFVFERRRPDRWIAILVALLLGLYAVNAGGGHGIAWLQGVRLAAEPLLLLLVGLILPDPRRTMRYALGALILSCCAVAAYGVLQQAVGPFTLVDWGYSFESQVRTLAGGQLRSFGTLDDPFAYAALLLFGIAALAFWRRPGPLALAAGALLLVGLGLSFVRTAIVVLVAFGGLALGRRGYTASAVLAVMAAVVAGGVTLANAGGSESRSYSIPASSSGGSGSLNVILNGRISAWEAALGDNPAAWVLGRGVGEVGTAAERASYDVAPSEEAPGTGGDTDTAVDSGYLATIADVGLAGAIVLGALFARLALLAGAAARRRLSAGWVALALLAALLLDALTRASFTGFPTAFLGLLLIGICLAAARETPTEPGAATPAARAGI